LPFHVPVRGQRTRLAITARDARPTLAAKQVYRGALRVSCP
jgi:hypothetical protein